jgi:hypothetical protein
MSKYEPIVISSGEENEVAVVKQIADKKDIVDLTSSPNSMSNFRLSRSKLKALKARKDRNRLRCTTNTHNNVSENCLRGAEAPVIKSSPSKLLQIDKTKLKQLRAVVKIELERSPDSKLARCLKKKKQSVKLLYNCIIILLIYKLSFSQDDVNKQLCDQVCYFLYHFQ